MTRSSVRAAPGQDIALRDVGLPTLLPLWLAGAYVAAYVVHYYPGRHTWGVDAHAYWLTAHHASLYGSKPGQPLAYLYSPAFAQLIHPIAILPWAVFLAIWMLLETTAFAWLLAPLGWRWAIPLLLLCSTEIGLGNIFGFLALALVLGMRHGVAWAFLILTKVTPGLCLIWFAVRRQWSRLAWSCVATVAIAGVSFLIDPGLWSDWVRFLLDSRGAEPSMPVRLVLAVLLVVYAARSDRAWLMAPALLLSCPLLHGFIYLTTLAATPRLRERPPDAADRGRPAHSSSSISHTGYAP